MDLRKLFFIFALFLVSGNCLSIEDHSFNFTKYHDYKKIEQFLFDFTNEHKDIVTLIHAGQSFENRDMYFLKISTDKAANKPVIYIESGAHAREWAALAFTLYLMKEIVNKPSQFNLEEFDWYILPVANPDGYQYSRDHVRMWRKTRSRRIGTDCVGVDLNRNYGYKFGLSGVSLDPCNFETYEGPHAFSEPEAVISKNIMHQFSHRIKAYVSLHSYGNYLVYPYGYSKNDKPKQWPILHELANAMAKQIEQSRGTKYKIMSAGEWYEGAGASDDYSMGEMKFPVVYTMEVSDGFGMHLPERELQPLFDEVILGFKYFAQNLGFYLQKINRLFKK